MQDQELLLTYVPGTGCEARLSVLLSLAEWTDTKMDRQVMGDLG